MEFIHSFSQEAAWLSTKWLSSGVFHNNLDNFISMYNHSPDGFVSNFKADFQYPAWEVDFIAPVMP